MIKNSVSRAWKLKGEMQMTIHGDSIYVFEFDNEDDRLSAIEFGLVFVANQLFLAWHELIEQELTELKSVPTWVNLRKVPLHMWNATCLSKIASLIGKPIMMDHLTLTKSRMSFARVLVEVDINCNYLSSLPVYYKGKHIVDVDVDVEYSWKPQICSECNCFCHTLAKCPKAKTKEVKTPAEQVKTTTTGEQQWVVKGSKKNGHKLLINVDTNPKSWMDQDKMEDKMEDDTKSPGGNKENEILEVENSVSIPTENMFDVLIEEDREKQQEVMGL